MRCDSFLKLMNHLASPHTEPELARAHPHEGTLGIDLPFIPGATFAVPPLVKTVPGQLPSG